MDRTQVAGNTMAAEASASGIMKEAIGNDSFDGDEQIPPLHSESELNLPPVEPWPEPVDGRVLLDTVKAWLVRFVVLPNWVAETVVLWVVHTFGSELRNVATHLGLGWPQSH